MNVLGIMNGTSGDGVDYVLAHITFKKKLSIQYLQHVHKPFDKAFHEKTKRIVTNLATTYEVGEYHHELGRLYAKHFAEIRWSKKPQLIGLHGQTVYHRGGHATFQLGEPSYLAMTANQPVIFNFRASDIAAGGQGAPLAPILHKVLLSDFKSPVAFHNLGGISNLTYCYKKHWLAFDTGPASTLLDIWIQNKTKGKKLFDDHGKIAAMGLPHPESLKKLMSHSFFKKTAPKSCGREEFNLDFIHAHVERKFHKLSLEDQMATLTELSAITIFDAYKKACPQIPEAIYFSGGGLQNHFLMQRLKIYFGAHRVKSSEELGWPSQAIEGGAFALLAYLRVYEQPLDLSTITGGRKATLLGQMCEV
jgi:anhydro-N-acetylmuramic acid kinase